jgi:hypothetical protein
VIRIGCYLLLTKEQGTIYRPDLSKGVKVYVYSDFSGGWDPGDAMNADNIYSRTGYVIQYAGCPIYWQSKLQTEIAVSTTEAEYIALSQALRETLPMTNLITEINVIFPLYLLSLRFVIKVREDNQPCIVMANNPKFFPHTRHIAINIITFASMSLCIPIRMVLSKLTIAQQMIKLRIFLQKLFVMIFSFG